MKKKLVCSFGGVLGMCGGVYLFYLFLNSLNDGGNFLFFGASLVLVGAASYSFYLADKPAKKEEAIELANPYQQTAEEAAMLEKNNKMSADFEKTIKAKEQLRLLELAANAEKNSNA